MVDYPSLKSNEIYPLPVGNDYLVYAPLSGHFFMLDQNGVDQLAEYIQTGKGHDEVRELVDTLLAGQSTQRVITRKDDISQIHKLTILPNYTCNFSCSYCYSAEGRSAKRIDRDSAVAAIDFFIDKKRTDLDKLWLAILGGGEPFLSAGIVGDIIKYARARAHEQGFRLGIGLTTNGSIYNKELSDIMIANHVSLGVSFEVLKDIQNAQRQDYDKVCSVIDKYLKDGVDVSVKSIITPLNVDRLSEMVGHLHNRFPKVRKYKLQIVEDASLFADTEAMKHFYTRFTDNFFEAEEKGYIYGIDVYVLASKYIDTLIEHYCGGEMCLTPEGSVTICHRFSSPDEKGYTDFVYGETDNKGKMTFDHAKFRSLIAHDISHAPKCRDCFVKWHCGGGCLAQSKIYNESQLNIICDWTREFTQKILLKRMEANL